MPRLPSSKTDVPNQMARGHSVQYSYAPELNRLLRKSAAETPQRSTSSLGDSGCFKSPADEIPSLCIMDDFDALIQQLKNIGNMDLAISGSPYLQDYQTVPYFPPVTSALRREHRMFNCPLSSCLEYDETPPSPQFLPLSSFSRDHASSLADVNSTSGTDLQAFQPLSESILMQIDSQSCPDISSPPAAASPADVQQCVCPTNDVCFSG